MAKITTTELVRMIYKFCEAYSGVTLFPYQEQFALRIIRSLLENDGDEITALFSRQSGKSETVSTICGGLSIILPVLANMPMFANDKRLSRFKNGLMIGCFAPTLRQAQIVFNRMKKRMGSKQAQEVLSDPEIDITFDVSNGQNVILSNDSLISSQSASEGSNIEGDSYMLIIVDESQDVGNFKYSKSISPMGAFYNATKILIGTATTQKGFFYDAIERNKNDQANGGRRNHFQYDYKVVQKYNPSYAKYIEGEKKRLGEDSDEFQMSYCVTPETKILTSDLRWVRADSIKVGDKLIGFDENLPKRYGQRKFKESFVEDVGEIERPCYKINLSDGTTVTCSEEHQWLVFTSGSRTVWKKTKDLVTTDRIYKVCDVWDDLPKDYRLGYLSASFDGEGNISQTDGYIRQICFAQRDNAMLSQVKQYLSDFGFDYNANYADKRKLELGQDLVYKLFIKGGKGELLRFLGSVRPQRLLDSFNPNKLGTVRCSNKGLDGDIHPKVSSIEFVGNKKVIPIRTSTRTYVAEGLASHNCLKWILERGMFIDQKTFDNLAYPEMGLSLLDTKKSHVVGIDLGKKNDSTVVTVLEVDWDNPIVIEKASSSDMNIPDYTAYNVCVKAWLEMQGDNWNEQYDKIVGFLSNFNVARIVMDATGVGDAIYDRLRANLDYEVIPYVFSKQAKSELYKHFNTEIKGGRVHYPADEETKETREYKKFEQQMLDLEKTYSGQLMICSHPNVNGAHDDYPDSLALAVYGAKGEPVAKPVTETGGFYSVNDKGYYRARNNLTARRR